MDRAVNNTFNSHLLSTQPPARREQNRYDPKLKVEHKKSQKGYGFVRRYPRQKRQLFGKERQEALAELYKVDEE